VPRLTKIYTRGGDDGTTSLGTGRRVSKTCARITAYGTVDELNSQLGVVLATQPAEPLRSPLTLIQNELLHAGAELCMPEQDEQPARGPKIEPRHVADLEALIDQFNAELPALENFVLPGGSPAAAQLQLARTVCRRAEREILRLAEAEPVGAALLAYLNRLSDLLFVMARYDNKMSGVDEPLWDSRA